jgi:hypothetical protein
MRIQSLLSIPTKVSRPTVDTVVVLGHLAAVLGVYIGDSDFLSTTAGGVILALECVTILFHLAYVISYLRTEALQSEWQHYKWLEYAISATLGSIAVAYIAGDNTEIPTNVITLLVAAGVAQQVQGYQLEKATDEDVSVPTLFGFLSAFLLQIGEFVVVGTIINDSTGTGQTEWIVFAGYVVGYTLFGLIMAVVLWGKPSKAHMEKLYSYAGLFSKLAVFIGDYAAYKHSEEGATAVLVIMCLAFVAILRSALYAPTEAEATSAQYRSY